MKNSVYNRWNFNEIHSIGGWPVEKGPLASWFENNYFSYWNEDEINAISEWVFLKHHVFYYCNAVCINGKNASGYKRRRENSGSHLGNILERRFFCLRIIKSPRNVWKLLAITVIISCWKQIVIAYTELVKYIRGDNSTGKHFHHSDSFFQTTRAKQASEISMPLAIVCSLFLIFDIADINWHPGASAYQIARYMVHGIR